MIEQFYRSLIVGEGVIVHQDYHHPHLPWIHVTMEAMSECFQIVDECVSDSIVFRYVAAPSASVLDRCIRYGFSPQEQLDLIDRAIARLEARNRATPSLAKVVLLLQLFGQRVAAQEFESVLQTYANTTAHNWTTYVTQVKARVGLS